MEETIGSIKYIYDVKDGKITYTFPDGDVLAIEGVADGSSRYDQIKKYQAEKEKEERNREVIKQARLKREQEDKQYASYNNSYAGLIFVSDNASRSSDSFQEAFVNALSQSTVTLTFLPNMEVNLRITNTSSSTDPGAELFAASGNICRNYKLNDLTPGKIIKLDDSGRYGFIISANKKSVTFLDNGRRTSLTPLSYSTKTNPTVYMGEIITDDKKSSLMHIWMTIILSDGYAQCYADYGMTSTGMNILMGGTQSKLMSEDKYKIEDGKLCLYNDKGEIDISLNFYQGRGRLYWWDGVQCMLTAIR